MENQLAIAIDHAPKEIMVFSQNGKTAFIDIVDGKLDIRGDLPVSDAARLLFEYLAAHAGDWWLERAARGNA